MPGTESDDRNAEEAENGGDADETKPAVKKEKKKKLRKKLKPDDEVIYSDPASGEKHAATVVGQVGGKGRYLIKLLSEEIELEAKASSLTKSDAADLQKQLDLEAALGEDDDADNDEVDNEVAVNHKSRFTLETITVGIVGAICFFGVIIILTYHMGG
jgi:hypothetical protein